MKKIRQIRILDLWNKQCSVVVRGFYTFSYRRSWWNFNRVASSNAPNTHEWV